MVSVVRHLVTQYNFTKTAVELALSSGDVYVLPPVEDMTKEAAFTAPAAVDSAPAPINDAVPQSSMPLMQPQNMPGFNPGIIDDSANLADRDVFDTGMLASLSGDENIRTHLVDMLPSFIDTTSKLGKVILLFAIYKDDLEDVYGREEYNKVMTANRKVFRSLGDVILDLKRCVNMQ
jgi:hypothetical protein